MSRTESLSSSACLGLKGLSSSISWMWRPGGGSRTLSSGRRLRQGIVKPMRGYQPAPVEVRPGGSQILHGDIGIHGVGAEQKDGTRLRLVEAPESILAGFSGTD